MGGDGCGMASVSATVAYRYSNYSGHSMDSKAVVPE